MEHHANSMRPKRSQKLLNPNACSIVKNSTRTGASWLNVGRCSACSGCFARHATS
jgi:hypothetical protein